jgi:hypothetical protein
MATDFDVNSNSNQISCGFERLLPGVSGIAGSIFVLIVLTTFVIHVVQARCLDWISSHRTKRHPLWLTAKILDRQP